MAGLPGKSAWVRVGPPLSCSGPNFASTLRRLFEPVSVAPAGLESRTWLAVNGPAASGPVAAVLLLMIVLSTVTVALPPLQMPPPPLAPAEFDAIVQFCTVTVA